MLGPVHTTPEKFENAALLRFSLFRFWVGRNTFRKRSFISVLGWTEYISKTQLYFGFHYFGFGLDGIHFENAALFRFSLFRFWVGRNTLRKRSFISVLGWEGNILKTQLYFGFGLDRKHFENAALFRFWVGQKTFRKHTFISVLRWTENISKTQLYFGFGLDGKH